MRWMACALVVGLGVLATAAARAEDWPRWLGPRGDNISTETGLADTWPPDGPPTVWRITPGAGYASPVAVKGVVYLYYMQGDDEVLAAYDAAKGALLWSQPLRTGFHNSHEGTRASPAIDGDRIYTYGGAGDLACRELAGGKLLWHINVPKLVNAKILMWGVGSNPTIVGDLILVQPGTGGPAVVAVNKTDGKIVWKSQQPDGSYASVLPIEVQGAKQLIGFVSKTVVAINPANGETIWTKPWVTNPNVHATTPIYRDGHLFITSGYGTGAMMLKLTPTSAAELWHTRDLPDRFQPPILDQGVLYINCEGPLKCVSWPDGKIKWTNTDAKLGMGGSLMRVGDKLITLSERGVLSLLKATPDECKLLSQTTLFKNAQKVWSSPLVYQGRLYCKGGNEFVCLDIRGK